MIGSGLFGLTSAGQAQLAQVRAMAAVKKNEFDALPPAEQAIFKFQCLMRLHPTNDWLYFFRGKGWTQKNMADWNGKLFDFVVNLDHSLLSVESSLVAVLCTHKQVLRARRTDLVTMTSCIPGQLNSDFRKVSNFYAVLMGI